MELKEQMERRDKLKTDTDKEISKINQNLFLHASEYKTYEELYRNVKQICKTTEEFNLSMLYCRPIFLNKNLTN